MAYGVLNASKEKPGHTKRLKEDGILVQYYVMIVLLLGDQIHVIIVALIICLFILYGIHTGMNYNTINSIINMIEYK